MSKHTQGKWLQSDNRVICGNGDDSFTVICAAGTSNRQNPDEAIANARLIASAPDLLSALESIALIAEKNYEQDEKLRANGARTLAALEYMVARVDALPPDDPGMLNVPRAHIHMREAAERARAAITKAKGE